MATRFQIEKFDGKGDFSLWKKKMTALLVQQKVAKAIEAEPTYPEDMAETQKQEMLEIAYSTIILYLANNVLRLVDEEDTALKVWAKLEKLYLVKSLSNKIYLKERFFGFKMDPNKSLDANLDEFNKIALEIANIEEKMSEENKVVILLNSLPDSYKEVKL